MTRFNMIISLAFIGFLAFSAQARADTAKPKPDALARLETMVSNLGYTTTDASDHQAFTITWPGKYSYDITFYLSNDETLGYAYVDLTTLGKDKLTKLPFVKLLEADDVGDFYFSMENTAKGERLYANTLIPLQGLTPPDLRDLLDGYVSKIDASDSSWNPDLWK